MLYYTIICYNILQYAVIYIGRQISKTSPAPTAGDGSAFRQGDAKFMIFLPKYRKITFLAILIRYVSGAVW